MKKTKSVLVEGSYTHELIIPYIWEFSKLKNVIEIIGGSQPPKSDFSDQEKPDHIRLIQIRDYKSDNNVVYIPKSKAKRFVKKDEVMIGRYGPPIFQILRGLEGAYNVALMKAKPIGGIFSNEYLYYFLSNQNLYNYVESASDRTAGQSGVNKKHLEEYPVPIPPLAEQKRIVEKLDQVLAQVDTIKARLDGIPAILKRFRQSVLAAAVSGKLTEEWRGMNELADASLSIDEFRGRALSTLPDSWSWKKFGEVVDIASNLVNPLETPNDIHIAPNHIEPRTGKLLEFKTVEEDAVKSSKHRFYSGQILYSKIRPYLCKAALVNFSGLCSADMYPLNTELEKRYLLNWLLSEQFTFWASNADSRTVLPKINKKQLSEIPVPVPSQEEQAEIVRLVDQYFAFADTIEQQVQKAQQRVDKLTQSILAKAFRGELVPQDPTDEPADELLKRIAAARAESEALAKAAKKVGQKK